MQYGWVYGGTPWYQDRYLKFENADELKPPLPKCTALDLSKCTSAQNEVRQCVVKCIDGTKRLVGISR